MYISSGSTAGIGPGGEVDDRLEGGVGVQHVLEVDAHLPHGHGGAVVAASVERVPVDDDLGQDVHRDADLRVELLQRQGAPEELLLLRFISLLGRLIRLGLGLPSQLRQLVFLCLAGELFDL
jgi:hypothetical protein